MATAIPSRYPSTRGVAWRVPVVFGLLLTVQLLCLAAPSQAADMVTGPIGAAGHGPRWWGPSDLIWQRCPQLASWGGRNATADDCMTHAKLLGANAVNYNTDLTRTGDACQLRNCTGAPPPEWRVYVEVTRT